MSQWGGSPPARGPGPQPAPPSRPQPWLLWILGLYRARFFAVRGGGLRGGARSQRGDGGPDRPRDIGAALARPRARHRAAARLSRPAGSHRAGAERRRDSRVGGVAAAPRCAAEGEEAAGRRL